MPSQNAPPPPPVLFGRLDSIKPLIDALSCIYSAQHKSQEVLIRTHPGGGLKFTVAHRGSLLASVIVPRSSFLEFTHAQGPTPWLRVNLSLLLECLNIFGGGGGGERFSTASVTLSYAGEGYPLEIRVMDGEKDCVCSLVTIGGGGVDEGVGEEDGFQFHVHEMVNMAVVSGEVLREAIMELDYNGASTAELRMSPEKPRFALASPAWGGETGVGGGGVCEVELADPGDRRVDMFQVFESRRTQVGRFRLEGLARCVKALGRSESCKVEMNDVGMVSVMCRMRGDEGGGADESCFVEFVIVALEIEEEEEEEEEGEDE